MFCPVCKNEYEPGYTRCPDCNVDLVEELVPETDTELYTFKSKNVAEKFLRYLKYSKLNAELSANETVEPYSYTVYTSEEELAEAKAAFAVFLSEESAETDISEELMQEDCMMPIRPKSLVKEEVVYTSASFKAEDTRSSGYILLGFGIIGLVAVVLCALGVIKFSIHPMSLAIMGIIFVGMAVYGVISLQKAATLAVNADAENKLIEDIKKWQKEHITDEVLSAAAEEGLSEEETALVRDDLIRNMTKEAFPNIPSALLEHLTDEFAEEIGAVDL
ncbi:MAG: hypothetical protein J5648_01290 [Lachnospiraceae bacterium]|nr:hypothetical protein [Lachnospiraceae bacterium]